MTETGRSRFSRLGGIERQKVRSNLTPETSFNDPPIILADEPTGNLDSHSGTLVLDLLYRSCKEIGKTLVLATHDRAVVQRADCIVERRDGAIGR